MTIAEVVIRDDEFVGLYRGKEVTRGKHIDKVLHKLYKYAKGQQ